MYDGHEAAHADLPRGQGKRIGLYRGPDAFGPAEVTHRSNGVVLKEDAEAVREDVIEHPDRKNPLREDRTPTQPHRYRGHGKGQTFGADVAQRASAAAVRGSLGYHDRERFGGARAMARGGLRP